MVQISLLWQFLIFLFPLLITLHKLQQKKRASLWAQLIVFSGSFLAVTNPPTYNYQTFLNDNLAKVIGVMLAWLAFQILRPSSDKRRSRRHIRALRREFLDQLSRHPHLRASRFESLFIIVSTSYTVAVMTRLVSGYCAGGVLLNCSHIVWQLRDWGTDSETLSAMRDATLADLHRIISERGFHHHSLTATLEELQGMINTLVATGGTRETELAGIIWRLYCSLSQLQQALPEKARAA